VNKITIEPLRPDRIPGVMSIHTECGLSDWSEQGYLDELERPDSIGFGAVIDDELSGFIVGRAVSEEAEVNNIGVSPSYRCHGVGSALLDAFLTTCKNRGVNTVWLEVRVSNQTAIDFYERHDFAKSSVRKGFYRSPDEDALIMARRFETDLSANNLGTLEN
jgi:ribosomal-protein-alanine N-acetyltransferase